MAYPESVDKFTTKLNKLDNNTYVIEEEVQVLNGVYEGELEHDNVSLPSINVYTGSKLTGTKVENVIVSTPSLTPWKKNIKIFSAVSPVYITYQTTGDTVESEDINKVQDSIVNTQTEVDRYKNSNDTRVANDENRLTIVENNKAEKTYVDTELNKRYLKTETYNKEETDQRIQNVVGAAPAALDTLQEIADSLGDDKDFAGTMTNNLSKKVDKVEGKQLSTEDYTPAEKSKLAGVQDNANNYIHPAAHPGSMIAEDSNHRWATDSEKSNWNSKAPGGYGLGTTAFRLSNGTDLNTIIKNGWYDCYQTINGVPDLGTDWHKILVICSSDTDYVTQIAFSMVGTGNCMWIRQKTVGSWSPWERIAKADKTIPYNASRPGNVDLNNYTTTGVYTLGGSLINVPSTFDANWGNVFVSQSADVISQLLLGLNSRMWYRNKTSGGGWTIWREVALIDEIPSSLPANGGTSSCLGNAVSVLDYNNLNPSLVSQGNITPIKAGMSANSPWNHTTAGFLIQSNDEDSFHILIFVSGGDGWAYRSYYLGKWGSWKIWSTFSGSYNDLSNKPSIPTKVSQLTNDSNFVTTQQLGNAGYGDMLKNVYDKNGDGVVNKSDYADNCGNADTLNGFNINQVMGNGIYGNAPTTTYAFVAKLLASNDSTFSKLKINVVGGGWGSGETSDDTMIFGNRGGFNYRYNKNGNALTRGRISIVAYQQSDGSVDVYIRLNGYYAGIVSAFGLGVNNNYTPLKLGSYSSTIPSGTVVFDSNTSPASALTWNDLRGV